MASAGPPFDDDAPAFSFEGGRDVVPEFARQTLDALAASAGTAIIGTDADGVITNWGAGAQALYGWTAAEIVGTSVFDRNDSGLAHEVEQVRETLHSGGAVRGWETERLRKDGTRATVQIDLELIRDESDAVIGVASIHRDVTEERVLAEVQRVNEHLVPTTLEYRIVRPDGTVVWLEDTSVVLPSEDAEPPRSQGYVFDISDRKRLEEQLLQSQKMDAVGQLAGGIAHDFNNILTAIEGYTEFALGRAAEDEALRDDLLEIRRAAARAATLTKQILAFGRRQVFHSRPLDLNDAIDETKKLILRLIGEHIEVVSHLEVPLGTVMADPSQITQVLVNLAVNARDAMPDGGRLTIETQNVVVDELEGVATGLDPGRMLCSGSPTTGRAWKRRPCAARSSRSSRRSRWARAPDSGCRWCTASRSRAVAARRCTASPAKARSCRCTCPASTSRRRRSRARCEAPTSSRPRARCCSSRTRR